ncbi:class I SAM-dependent methyltransferase [Pseudodesulfovibrio portus]|uniref:Methyltransferase type 11 domain-containing protein n=1 Tax=Pseudodesulfovibrio portus TaxID=231439 RepID=A0ABN6RQ66_9BACT|nr:class I SAM-dependent methyltransferase [Pseudodesulfovibrio portus]BDQ32982.1 hypothetical protein JCM14722_05240 [Pseudodesulfovibrio portus]
MAKHTRAFIDFYDKHKISPVSQDVSDLDAHYARRQALYRQLGMVPSFLKGKNVLEFGPGSGHNALYTANLNPARYVLVDANPTGLAETRKRLENNDTEIVVVESFIEDFKTDERFDLVMCEGCIPWQIDPQGILKNVARFVAPGGAIFITCIDEISALGDNLRRLEAHILIDKSDPIDKQVAQLLPVFKNDLDSLSGMSRPYEDWILDQILQPFIGNYFSIEEAITTLDAEFDVHAASPDFLTDWTWYKEVPLRATSDNQLGIRSYRENLHNFIDYRCLFPPRHEANNMHLAELIREFTKTELQYETTGKDELLAPIRSQLQELAKAIGEFSQQTAASVTDFEKGLGTYLATGEFPALPDFTPFFGRGQQYLSFIRK